jgi:1-acyl-sn-glycerol-3-phosphate acyltransferase
MKRFMILDFFNTPKLYWYRFILFAVAPFYIRFFKLKAVGLENLPRDGSYMMVANHSHFVDPFFIGALIKKPVFQMASNEYFRKPLVRRFMWAMGAFPRKKGTRDDRAIKYAIRIVRKGFPLIIYPEGGRNWDGETLSIIPSTAKLVKLLKVPLVTIVSKGNYLAYPRWANRRRKCAITIYFSEPRTFDKNSTDREIIKHIKKGIYNNDNYTDVKKIKGKNPAEGLTRLLWRCPQCRELEALVEKDGKHIECSLCKNEWEVNLNCYMQRKGEYEWRAVKNYADLMFNENEILPYSPALLDNHIQDILEPEENIYLISKEVILYQQPHYPKLKKLGNGSLYLTNQRIIFVRKSDCKPLSYKFSEISGRSTEKNTFFQIFLYTGLARFKMLNESCYKWEIMYDFIRKKGGYKSELE